MGEIKVIAIGKVPDVVLEHLCKSVEQVFWRVCRIGGSMAVPADAFDERRGQYSADQIITRLPVGEAERVLGVIDYDLYAANMNFVYGVGDPYTGRAIISLTRLSESFSGGRAEKSVFLARVVKEAVHELGHTYGLGHCKDRRCVMAFSNSLGDTDYKGQEFCIRCLMQL